MKRIFVLTLKGKQAYFKVTVNGKYHGSCACKIVRRVLLLELVEEHVFAELPKKWKRARIHAVLPTLRVR